MNDYCPDSPDGKHCWLRRRRGWECGFCFEFVKYWGDKHGDR